MLKKEFEFILQDNLVYSHNGQANIIAKKLLLRAPTTRLLSLASKLSSIVTSALIKAREQYKSENTDTQSSTKQGEDIDGSGIYMLVSGCTDIDKMNKLTDYFIELILSDDICLIDGKEQITSDLLNSIDSRETLRLMGDYIANFLLPSVMQTSKKKN